MAANNNDGLTIHIGHLRRGTQALSGVIDPSALDVDDVDLAFRDPVKVVGTAYLADDDLVVRFSAQTTAMMPCKVCNNPVNVPIEANERYSAIPLAEIKENLYDLTEQVREELLYVVPPFAECNGKCSEREMVKAYFRDEKKGSSLEGGLYHPFDEQL